MDLKTWLSSKGVVQKKLADELGLSPSYFSELLSGKRRFNPKLSRKVEELTKGEVSRMELLYPDQESPHMSEHEYVQPGFLLRGSPLTPEMRARVLKGNFSG
jgi:DNA-binding transcriptional regulator YdaS (Cro superfamily)